MAKRKVKKKHEDGREEEVEVEDGAIDAPVTELKAGDYVDVIVKGRVKAVGGGVAHIQIEQQTLNKDIGEVKANDPVVVPSDN